MGVDGRVAGRLLCLVSLFFWGMEMREEGGGRREMEEMEDEDGGDGDGDGDGVGDGKWW